MASEILDKAETMLRVQQARRVSVVGQGTGAAPIGVSKANLLFALIMTNQMAGFQVETDSDGNVSVGNFS